MPYSGRLVHSNRGRISRYQPYDYVHAGLRAWDTATNAYNWAKKNLNKHQGPATGPFGYPLSYKKRKTLPTTHKSKKLEKITANMGFAGHENKNFKFSYPGRKVSKHTRTVLKDITKRVTYGRISSRTTCPIGSQKYGNFSNLSRTELRNYVVSDVTADAAAYYENNVFIFGAADLHMCTNNTTAVMDFQLLHFKCIKSTTQRPDELLEYGEVNLPGGAANDSFLYNISWHDQTAVCQNWKLVGQRKCFLGPGETVRSHIYHPINKKLNLTYFAYHTEDYLANISNCTILVCRGAQVVALKVIATGAFDQNTTSAACVDWVQERRVVHKPFPVGLVTGPKIVQTSTILQVIPAGEEARLITEDTDDIEVQGQV